MGAQDILNAISDDYKGTKVDESMYQDLGLAPKKEPITIPVTKGGQAARDLKDRGSLIGGHLNHLVGLRTPNADPGAITDFLLSHTANMADTASFNVSTGRDEYAEDFVGGLSKGIPGRIGQVTGILSGAAMGGPGMLADKVLKYVMGGTETASKMARTGRRFAAGTSAGVAEGLAHSYISGENADQLLPEVKDVATDAALSLFGHGVGEGVNVLMGGRQAKELLTSRLSSPMVTDTGRELKPDEMLAYYKAGGRMEDADPAALANLNLALASLPIDPAIEAESVAKALRIGRDAAVSASTRNEDQFRSVIGETFSYPKGPWGGAAPSTVRRAAITAPLKVNSDRYKALAAAHKDKKIPLTGYKKRLHDELINESTIEDHLRQLPENTKLALKKVYSFGKNKADKDGNLDYVSLLNTKKDIDGLLSNGAMLSPDTGVDKAVRASLIRSKQTVNDILNEMTDGAYGAVVSKYADTFAAEEAFDDFYTMVQTPSTTGVNFGDETVPYLNNAVEYYDSLDNDQLRDAAAEGLKSAVYDLINRGDLLAVNNILGAQLSSTGKSVNMSRANSPFSNILKRALGDEEFDAFQKAAADYTQRRIHLDVANRALDEMQDNPVSFEKLDELYKEAMNIYTPVVASGAQMYRPSQLSAVAKRLHRFTPKGVKEDVSTLLEDPTAYERLYNRANRMTHKGVNPLRKSGMLTNVLAEEAGVDVLAAPLTDPIAAGVDDINDFLKRIQEEDSE